MLTMTALLNLHEHSGQDAYLRGAERAGKLQFVKSKFGYKDTIPHWKAEQFDPEPTMKQKQTPGRASADNRPPMLLVNVDHRQTISLNGDWHTIADPYGTGLYTIHGKLRADGYFMNGKQEPRRHTRKARSARPSDGLPDSEHFHYPDGQDHLTVRVTKRRPWAIRHRDLGKSR
jgi:hypothetical protein